MTLQRCMLWRVNMRFHLIQHSGLFVCGEWECYGRGWCHQQHGSSVSLTLERAWRGAHFALHAAVTVQERKMRLWKSEMQNALLILAMSRKKHPPRCARDQVCILQSWSSFCWCRTFWPPPIRTTFWRSDSGQRQNDTDQSKRRNCPQRGRQNVGHVPPGANGHSVR